MAYYGHNTTINQGAGALGQLTGKLQAYADGVVGGPPGGGMPGSLMSFRDGSLGEFFKYPGGASGVGEFFKYPGGASGVGQTNYALPMNLRGLGQTDYGIAIKNATKAQIAQICEWLIVSGWVTRCDRNLLLRIGRDIDDYSRGSKAGSTDLRMLYQKGILTRLGYEQFVKLATSQMAGVGAFFSAGLRGLGCCPPSRDSARPTRSLR